MQSLLTTPQFEGTLKFGPGSYLYFDFAAQYLAPIKIGDLIAIKGHPDYPDARSAGPQLKIFVHRPCIASF